jgi:hypothetical protein
VFVHVRDRTVALGGQLARAMRIELELEAGEG